MPGRKPISAPDARERDQQATNHADQQVQQRLPRLPAEYAGEAFQRECGHGRQSAAHTHAGTPVDQFALARANPISLCQVCAQSRVYEAGQQVRGERAEVESRSCGRYRQPQQVPHACADCAADEHNDIQLRVGERGTFRHLSFLPLSLLFLTFCHLREPSPLLFPGSFSRPVMRDRSRDAPAPRLRSGWVWLGLPRNAVQTSRSANGRR